MINSENYAYFDYLVTYTLFVSADKEWLEGNEAAGEKIAL